MPFNGKRMSNLITVRAGTKAFDIIRDEGLNPDRIKVVAGASGSAKFLVLTGIDRVMMALFNDRTDPLYLLGTSIGAFRMAAFCQEDPLRAINRLETAYIHQSYKPNPGRIQITRETKRILDAYIDDRQISHMLNHPFLKICILSNRCRGLMKSEIKPLQFLGIGMAAAANLISRELLGFFFHRALFIPKKTAPPFVDMNQFPMSVHPLDTDNFKQVLFSTGAIPVVMEGVSNIKNVPGVFRDGGILDYHLDIPFLGDCNDGLVLFPHFYDTMKPGWFDKKLKRQPSPDNTANVVLVSPSDRFVKSLPYSKIPDRQDFYLFNGDNKGRIRYWQEAAKRCRELGDAFYEAIESGRIKTMVQPL